MARSVNFNWLFINEVTLKTLTVINENADMKVITPTIILAQDKYLTKLLGDSLMADLQDKGAIGGLNTNETFLIDSYIQQALTWAIMLEASPNFVYRYMNKGIEKKNSDNSNPPELNEIQYLVNKAQNNFDWYAQRLIDYLEANSQLFPAYRAENTSDEKFPTNRGYRTSWYLGRCEDSCSPRVKYR